MVAFVLDNRPIGWVYEVLFVLDKRLTVVDGFTRAGQGNAGPTNSVA